ncbi:MAG TPA: DUF1877 family protein [Kofleriaceae bacterium]|nr:DUF1877 family protein [Kofleriaceae bacterium]
MGMYATFASLNEPRRSELERNSDAVVKAAAEAVNRDEDWVLDLGKNEMAIAAALRVYADGLAAGAASVCEIGQEVGTDLGYGRARYLRPDQVHEIAARLAEIEDAPFPLPDPDGYAPDPRLETDPRLQRVAHACELYGPDPDDRGQMDDLTARFEELRRHYRNSADRGDGMLLFIR